MIWAGIVHDKVIGPIKVDEGVMLNNENYCELLVSTFFDLVQSSKSRTKNGLCGHERQCPLSCVMEYF